MACITSQKSSGAHLGTVCPPGWMHSTMMLGMSQLLHRMQVARPLAAGGSTSLGPRVHPCVSAHN